MSISLANWKNWPELLRHSLMELVATLIRYPARRVDSLREIAAAPRLVPELKRELRRSRDRVRARDARLKKAARRLQKREARTTTLEQKLSEYRRRLAERDDQIWDYRRTIKAQNLKLKGRSQEVVRLDYPGAEIYISGTTNLEARKRARSCAKEPWTIKWIEDWVKSEDVLYDIGANVGTYSLVAARSSGGAKIYAIEPGYANFAALIDNVTLNKCDETIVPMPVVLAAKTGLDHFNYSDIRRGASKHSLESAQNGDAESPIGVYRQPVLTYRLDHLIEAFDLPTPNHIKLDVDGSELAVLEGATHLLQSPELRSMMIEIDKRLTDAVVGLLSAAGWTLREKHDERDGVPLTAVWYGLFTRPESTGPDRSH